MKPQITKRDIINQNITRVLLAVAILTTPVMAMGYTQNLSSLAYLLVGYFNQAIYVIISLAIVVFVWNIYNYFFKADVENKKDAGLYVMYSVIGFFVIIAFWGLVNIVGNTFNLNNNIPSLNFFGSSLNGSGGSSGGSSGTFSAPPAPAGSVSNNVDCTTVDDPSCMPH